MRKLLLASCFGVAAMFTAGYAVANDELAKMAADPNQWVMPAGNFANTRYSELKQINTENVHKIAPAWTFSTGVLRGHEGAPLVIGDTMFVHAPFPNTIFALDLNNDGKILWKYEPKQDPNVIPVMCCDTVNRGLSYADGKIFLHQADTTLVALDAKTGAVVWSVKDGDPSKGATGTDAPYVFKDKVYIGVSGGEFGVRGWLSAYNIKDGKLAWRAYSEGPDSDLLVDPEKTTALGKPIGKDSSLKTWQGDQWKIGGGDTWGWYSYDPDLNLIYYGSGNPSTWNPKQRPGDNKWSMTIWARDADTGMAKWVYQMTPHDEWDYDGVNEMILTDQKIDGKDRKLLTHFDRNGFGYTLDRTDGELLVANKFDPKVNWATGINMDKSSPDYGRPIRVKAMSTEGNGEDVNSKGICPAALGSKDEQPAAYSPETELFYVPTNHVCMDYEPFKVSYTAGQPYVGATLSMYPPAGRQQHGQLHRLGRQDRQDRLVRSRAVLGLVGRSGDRGRRRLLRDAGRLSQGGGRQDGQGALQVQDPVGHHRQRHDLRARRSPVCGDPVRRRRLGGHRPCGRSDQADRGSGRGRRLRGAFELHRARRHAHCVRAPERLSDLRLYRDSGVRRMRAKHAPDPFCLL